jgi:hypothetical protein
MPCLILLLSKHRRDRNQSINCVGDETQKAIPACHTGCAAQHNASLWYGVTQRVHNNCYFIHGQRERALGAPPPAPRHYRRRTWLVCMRCTQRAFCWCVYFAPARFCGDAKWAIPTQHGSVEWRSIEKIPCQTKDFPLLRWTLIFAKDEEETFFITMGIQANFLETFKNNLFLLKSFQVQKRRNRIEWSVDVQT